MILPSTPRQLSSAEGKEPERAFLSCALKGGVDGEAAKAAVAMGGKVIKCPSPLNVLKDAYDRSCH